MRTSFTLLFIYIFLNKSFSQADFHFQKVAEIKWDSDYQVFLKMLNDSDYVYDIRNLLHIPKSDLCLNEDYIYYPVNLSSDYVDEVNKGKDTLNNTSGKTLFSALNYSLGGGWVHFINCMLYSIEKGQLSLTAPLMQRPVSNWKPDPVTDSYRRTRNWKYYAPVEQKNALREYKYRLKHNEMAALNGIPAEFIDFFLQTSPREYTKLKNSGDLKNVAKIDLVKLMLGSNYLGPAQITYIRSAVLNSVKDYSINLLPTVLIFDEFDAAAVMSLNLNGYSLDAIVFKKASEMTEVDKEQKKSQIISLIDNINRCNHNTFIRNLSIYYKN